jgi:hypothetical protein
MDFSGMGISGADSLGNIFDLITNCGQTLPAGFTASCDFSNPGTRPVTITHTATGKQAVFYVNVKADAKDITSLKVGDTWGVISGTNITVTLPYNSSLNLASVTPTVAHTGASYSPTGAQDFSTSKTYTVTASDGTTKPYTVTVQKAALSSIAVTTQPTKTIYGLETAVNTGMNYSGMSILGVDSAGNNISLVSSYTGGTTLPAGFTVSYDFRTTGIKTVTLTHTASGKTAALYPDVRDFSLLSNLSVTGRPFASPFTPSTASYSLYENLDYATTSVTVSATAAESAPAPTVSGAGSQSVNVGANTFTVTVTPPSGYGTAKSYTITVNRKPATPVWGPVDDADHLYSNANTLVYSTDRQAHLAWTMNDTANVTQYEYYTSASVSAPAASTNGTVTGSANLYYQTSGAAYTPGPWYFWVRARAGTVAGDWSAVRPMIIGEAFASNAALKSRIAAGGTIYLVPFGGTRGLEYEAQGGTSSALNVPTGKMTTIIPATGKASFRLSTTASGTGNLPITVQYGGALILGGTEDFGNTLYFYGNGNHVLNANNDGAIECLGNLTLNRGVLLQKYYSSSSSLIWVHGQGLCIFNAGAEIESCRAGEYIILRSTVDGNAHTIDGGGTFTGNTAQYGNANWG